MVVTSLAAHAQSRACPIVPLQARRLSPARVKSDMGSYKASSNVGSSSSRSGVSATSPGSGLARNCSPSGLSASTSGRLQETQQLSQSSSRTLTGTASQSSLPRRVAGQSPSNQAGHPKSPVMSNRRIPPSQATSCTNLTGSPQATPVTVNRFLSQPSQKATSSTNPTASPPTSPLLANRLLTQQATKASSSTGVTASPPTSPQMANRIVSHYPQKVASSTALCTSPPTSPVARSRIVQHHQKAPLATSDTISVVYVPRDDSSLSPSRRSTVSPAPQGGKQGKGTPLDRKATVSFGTHQSIDMDSGLYQAVRPVRSSSDEEALQLSRPSSAMVLSGRRKYYLGASNFTQGQGYKTVQPSATTSPNATTAQPAAVASPTSIQTFPQTAPTRSLSTKEQKVNSWSRQVAEAAWQSHCARWRRPSCAADEEEYWQDDTRDFTQIKAAQSLETQLKMRKPR